MELVADVFAKNYSISPKPLRYVLALTCFVICNMFWLNALKNSSGLARGRVIFAVGAAVGVWLWIASDLFAE